MTTGQDGQEGPIGNLDERRGLEDVKASKRQRAAENLAEGGRRREAGRQDPAWGGVGELLGGVLGW